MLKAAASLLIGLLALPLYAGDITSMGPDLDPEEIYSQLAGSRTSTYWDLSEDLQREMWAIHLRRAITETELSDEQLSVVLESLGFLNSGLAYFDRSTLEYTTLALPILQTLEHKIRAAFSPAFGRLIFASIGPDVDFSGEETAGMSPVGARGGYLSDCDCSLESDWCLPTSFCGHRPVGECTPHNGCGTLWAYPCDGVCL